MRLGQRFDRSPHQIDPLVTHHSFVDVRAIGRKLHAGYFAELIQRNVGSFATSAAQYAVERDPIKPSKKLAVALKRIEFQKRADKRVLHGVFGFVRRTGHLQHRREQPILVPFDQLGERRPIPLDRLIDQLRFVGHVVKCGGVDDRRGLGVNRGR